MLGQGHPGDESLFQPIGRHIDDSGLLSLWWEDNEQILISPDLGGNGIPDDLEQITVNPDVTGETLLASNRLRVGVTNVFNSANLTTQNPPSL
jgi:hypothetical protein